MPDVGPGVAALVEGAGLPRAEALRLLARTTGRSRESLIADSGGPLSDAAIAAFRTLAARRIAGVPIAYLVGEREFYGRRFVVGPAVLIPRPETELLVDVALAAVDGAPAGLARRVLDLGTGSGVVAITLKAERPGLDVVATDASVDALAVARENAVMLGTSVDWRHGDWYDALAADDGPYDLIASNPPYIAADDRHLAEGDLRFEPVVALTDGGDGLEALRRIAAGACARLAAGGLVAVEHGHRQADAVRALLQDGGLGDAVSYRDLAGIERVTTARRLA